MGSEIRKLILAAGLGTFVLLAMVGLQVTEWQYLSAKVAPDNLERPWICRAQCVSDSGTALCASQLVSNTCTSPWHLRHASISECQAWVDAPCEGVADDGTVAAGAILEPSLVELDAPLGER